MQVIKPSELKELVKRVVIEGKLPVMVWGSSGIGKSEIINAAIREMSMESLDLRLNYYEESDMLGIPMMTDNGMEFIKYSAFPKSGKGVWFLDELTHAKTSIQGLAFQLINDYKMESYQVPEGWQHFIAASNRIQDRTISNVMPSGLANRFTGGHYELIPDLNEWRIWALLHDVDGVIVSFLSYMDKNDKKRWLFRQEHQEAFLTPRVWARGVNYALKRFNTNVPMRDVMIKGVIGEDNGVEFIEYINRVKKMPDIEAMLNGDYSWFKKVKDDAESLSMYYIVVSGLVNAVKQNIDMLSKSLNVMDNMSDEFAVYFLQLMKQMIPNFSHIVVKQEAFVKNVKRYIKYLEDF